MFSAWAVQETFIEAVLDHHSHPATLTEALNLDITEALAIGRQVEDDIAQLLQAFSS